MDVRGLVLRRAFDAAIAAARPQAWLPQALAGIDRPRGRALVVAIGKASIGMAQVLTAHWGEPFEGLAVTPRGTGSAVEGFRVLEASHPVPDEASLAAGEAVLAMAASAERDDLLLILLSGGASALACAPLEGVSLALKAEVTRRLLASGLDIHAVNTVRRALSRLKGGGLLRAAGTARVATLAQSDVPFDRVPDIGSGPGVPSPTASDEALAVLSAAAPDLADALAAPLREHAPAPIRARWSAGVAFGLNHAAAAAAASLAGEGVRVEGLGRPWNDAAAAAALHLQTLDGVSQGALVSGGETTVALPAGATGRGGRNQHFLLALAIGLAGRGDVWALAADTDGIDGASDAAGAWLDPALLGDLDVDEARAALNAFDAYGFFARHGRLIQTGPTGVNVGDLRIVLVDRGIGP